MTRKSICMLGIIVVMLSFIGCGNNADSDNALGDNNGNSTAAGSAEETDTDGEGFNIDAASSFDEGEIGRDTVVLTVGGNKTSYDEVLLYFRSYKQKIEDLYGSDVWDYVLDDEGTTYAEMLKDKILKELKYIKIICDQAESLDMSLAEDEKLDVKEYTADYMSNFTSEDLKDYGFTEDTVRKIYEENMLANKIYELLTLNVDTDIDDEEVRHAVFLYIFISKTAIDENGNKAEYTIEEQEEVRLYAEEVRLRTEEEDFYALAKECSEDEDEIEFTAVRKDMIPEFADAAFSLKEGEISGLLENDEGYFIFYCKSEKDEAATEDAKIKLIVERQNNAFYEIFNEWEGNTIIKLNEMIWDQINFNNLLPAS